MVKMEKWLRKIPVKKLLIFFNIMLWVSCLSDWATTMFALSLPSKTVKGVTLSMVETNQHALRVGLPQTIIVTAVTLSIIGLWSFIVWHLRHFQWLPYAGLIALAIGVIPFAFVRFRASYNNINTILRFLSYGGQ